MKAAELADALGLPARQIRYMISEGIIPGANVMGRGVGAFDEAHLAAGRRYLELKAQGLSSFEIKRLMAQERRIPLYEGHPVTLTVDPMVDPASIDVEAVLADVAAALRNYVNPSEE